MRWPIVGRRPPRPTRPETTAHRPLHAGPGLPPNWLLYQHTIPNSTSSCHSTTLCSHSVYVGIGLIHCSHTWEKLLIALTSLFINCLVVQKENIFYQATKYKPKSKSINQSIRDCLSSRATSRLIIECIETAGSDDNVRIWFSQEPGFKLLTEGRLLTATMDKRLMTTTQPKWA